jgi:hypothetical protein
MTRNNWDRGFREFAIDHMEVGATDTTREHLDQDFAWPGNGLLNLDRIDVAETELDQRHRLHLILWTVPAGDRPGSFPSVREASEPPPSICD